MDVLELAFNTRRGNTHCYGGVYAGADGAGPTRGGDGGVGVRD